MILIVKGQTNRIVVTATEMTTSQSLNFRLSLKNTQERKTKEIILENQSEHTSRYDLFLLKEGAGGDIQLVKGEYSYKIYDSNDELCEEGRALVVTEEQAIEYAYPFPDKNNVIYS